MPNRDPLNTNPATLRKREHRARIRAERIASGWRDGRYRDPAKAPTPPYLAVQRWRMVHREASRANDRVYKGMKRNPLFMRAWPVILAHYGSACLRCGSTALVAPDHVLPVADAPLERNCLANLQPLCRSCNAFKRSRSDDYRPDRGGWIAASFPEASLPLHPTGRRARYGSNGWAMANCVPCDTTIYGHPDSH